MTLPFRVPYSIWIALSALVVTLAATPVVIRLARLVGAIDRPGPRRIHREPVPTAGGLAMIVAVLGVAWAARVLPGPARVLNVMPLIGLTVAAIPVTIFGIVDDMRGTTPWSKLIAQIGSAAILFGFGFGVPLISNPFGPPIETGVFNLILTVGWVVVVMNAINLIDGLDGLAAGAVLISSVTLWFVGREHYNFYVMFISSAVIGATIGFLRYNFPPARVFMGDTGSQFLGLLLAAISLLENEKGTATITLLFPLVAMLIPIADGVIAFVRRTVTGRPVFRADSDHIHHRLLRLGLSQRNVVLVMWFLCVYCGVMAIVLAALPPRYGVMLAVTLALGLFFAFEVLEFIDRRLATRDRDAPRRDD